LLTHDPATFATYTLSLHDALPILKTYSVFLMRKFYGIIGLLPMCGLAISMGIYPAQAHVATAKQQIVVRGKVSGENEGALAGVRSEEHTSELQSRENLVCRLLLEK